MVTETTPIYTELGHTDVTGVTDSQELLIAAATPYEMETVALAAQAEQPPNAAMVGLVAGIAIVRKHAAIAASNYTAANQWASVCRQARKCAVPKA